ncbi:hypothetical protein K1T71_004625 [Dendrolimus kikuchii]|uniref:Uncharacterized protein n=1 Tax=Dendrolimus kikuchii TaxID=765133 RepID=A0ACC1D7T6_9NEOP|nr:hypothetical protein K1T71_004625 [Dendrolimus kikuchii]
MRAELVQARAASADGCQDGGDVAGNVTDAARARAEAAQLARENAALRETVLALHSELFGARLATKYLDKELAGRIQQLQLLGRDMRAELRDSLWAQVEAEILLQRHKTLVRVCRGVSPRPPRPPPVDAPRTPRARPRTVRVRRSPHLGLGISVTGGREHGACHKEAVQALQSVKGDCALCVQFIATDDDDRLSEDNYRFPLYPEDGEAFDGEPDGSGATPTAPRTPEFDRPPSEVGSTEECCARYEPTYLPQLGQMAPPAMAAAPAPYPDYNNINNNLNILDMDDDSIKIEARLEWGTGCVVREYSSGESPRSTPVHSRPLANKKKRKPQDWRTKGAYRPVEVEAPSSDEPRVETPRDAANVSDGVPQSPLTQPSPQETVTPLIEVDTKPVQSDGDIRNKPNGDLKSLRRESKGFRIGSARRITEGVGLTNGSVSGKGYSLLHGDGDPDFGTPV